MVESYEVATVNLSINLEMSRRLPAPRTVFVKYPHGASLGPPGDVDQQRTILRDLFRALQDLEQPGEIVEPGYRWRHGEFPPVGADTFQR